MVSGKVTKDVYIIRKGMIEELDRFLKSKTSNVLNVFTNGDGGIGKTLLISEFQRYCNSKSNKYFCLDSLIDFYNTKSHTKLGVIRQIATDIGLENLFGFKTILEEYDETSDVSILPELERIFIKDFREFAEQQKEKNRCLVLFFDTYEAIQNIDKSAMSADSTEFSLWLEKKLLPKLVGNTKFVISGRFRLKAVAPTNLDIQPLELSHFSLSETKDFLKTCFDGDEALLVEKIGSDAIINSFHILADGRPILLALFVDAVNQKDSGFPQDLLETIIEKTGDIVEPLEKEQTDFFKKALIQCVAALTNPADRMVPYMAIARRRITSDLLFFLLNQLRPKEEICKSLQTLESFSYIKVIIGDGESEERNKVYLLHDELQQMFVEIWWQKNDADGKVRQEIANDIVKFYERELLTQKLSEVEREIYTAEAIEYEFFASAKEEPGKALERFGEEFDIAFQDGHYDRCEMLLRIAEDYYHDLGFPQKHHIDWRRLDYFRQRIILEYGKISQQARQLLDDNKDCGKWQESELPGHLWYVYGATVANSDESIVSLKRASEIFCKRSMDYWMYRTDNLIGYTYYRQGNFPEALRFLERARKGFYRLLIYERPSKAENAEKGNAEKEKTRKLFYGFLLAMGNLAIVYSYTGQFERAIRKAELALTLIRRLPRNQQEIARSDATVGHISLLLGDRVNAGRHLFEANELLHKIQNRQIEGRVKPDLAFLRHRIDRFAYLLEYYRAEELEWLKEHRISEEDIAHLQEARELVQDAISILEEEPPIEKELADAHYVLGELYMATPGKAYWQKAEEAFENALNLGKESGFLYRVADTLESLVTLYYFWNGTSDITPDSKELNSQKKDLYQKKLELMDLLKYPELKGKFEITLGDEQFDRALALLRKQDSSLLDKAKIPLNEAFLHYVAAVQWMKLFNEERHYLALRVFYNRLKSVANEERAGKIFPISEHLEKLRPLWKEHLEKFGSAGKEVAKDLDRIYPAVMARLLPKDKQERWFVDIYEQIQHEITQWNIGLASIFNACLLEVYRLLSPKGNENDEYLEKFFNQLILQANYYRIVNDEYQSHHSLEIVRRELKCLRDQSLRKAIEGYVDCQEGTLTYRRGEYGRFLEIFLQDDLDIGRKRFDGIFPGARDEAFTLLERGERRLQEVLTSWERSLENTRDHEKNQLLKLRIKRYRQRLGETRFRLGELLMLNEQYEDDADAEHKGALSYLKMAIEDTKASEDWYRYEDSVQSYVNALYFSKLYDTDEYTLEYNDYIAELEESQRYPSVMGKLRIMQGDVLFSQYFQRRDEPEGEYHYIINKEQENRSREQREEIMRQMWSYYVEACNFTRQQGMNIFATAVAILQRRIQLIEDAEALEMGRQSLQSLWERQPYLETHEEELYTLSQFAEMRSLLIL